jgi:hypothetical protein
LTARHRQAACASSPRVEIDIENYVQYRDDGRDPSKFATDVNERTTTRVFAAFTSNLHLGQSFAFGVGQEKLKQAELRDGLDVRYQAVNSLHSWSQRVIPDRRGHSFPSQRPP